METSLSPKLVAVLVVATLALAIVVLGLTIGPVVKRAANQAKIKAKGRDARATIRAIRETGAEINERPEVEMSLWVEPKAGPGYAASLVVTVSVTELANVYRVGQTIHVRVSAEDPQQLALVGPAPGSASAAPN